MEVESTTSTVAFHNQENCCVITRPTENENKKCAADRRATQTC